MRKFLFFLLCPFMLLSCEMQSKQTLCASVAMANAMCPMPVGDTELMFDSVLYKGKEKRIRFCYSFKASEDREQYEENLRKSGEKYLRFCELLDLAGTAQLNDIRLYMTWADFDLQISYLDSKGGVLQDFVYGKDEYNMSREEILATFPSVMKEAYRDVQSKLPMELDLSTVFDSLFCDTKNHRVVQYYTIHDFNMEGLNVDAIFAYNKKLIVDNLISNYNSLIFMAVSGYSWEFVHDYKMNGSSLSRFSITRKDLDSAMLESFRN